MTSASNDPGRADEGLLSLRRRLRLERVLLRSRFGRRLLVVVLWCALLPTLAVGLFSFVSVRAQLSDQADGLLQDLVLSAGHVTRDRLTRLDSDLRLGGYVLPSCLALGETPRMCVDPALRSLDALALVEESAVTSIVGPIDDDLVRAVVRRARLAPDASGVFVLMESGPGDLALVHRLASARQAYLVGRISLEQVWADARTAMPEEAFLTLLEAGRPAISVAGAGREYPVVDASVQDRMVRSASGAFRWAGRTGRYRAAYWSFPSTQRLRLPSWRMVLSQPETAVYGPMQDFTRTFPVLVLILLLAVLGFGLGRIRQRVIPLEALHEGARRLARQQFDTRVEVASGDEIEELAASFNTMAATVDKQLNALRTAAEIDRAVLSRMDRTEIVETALYRLPELVACEGVTLVLLEPAYDGEAVMWSADAAGRLGNSERLVLASEEVELLRSRRERLVLRANHPSLPSFLAPLQSRNRGHRIEVYPLRFGEDLCGALSLRRAIPMGLADQESVQIRRLTDQIAIGLGNAGMMERVRFLAFYDSLTGLPNRVLYKERLDQALLRAERRRAHVALCFLDLDQFSTINDSLGHDVGDELIEQVAKRLLTVCRESDTVARLGNEPGGAEVARLGGDEFTVVLPDLVDPQDAGRVAQRLLACFREPFRLGTHEVFVSTSIGVAVYPEDGADVETLLKNADVAMYHAKEQGRNSYRMYSASMNAAAVQRLQLEQQLRRAVAAGEFSLVYQPIIDVATGRVSGAEALVRWNHPDRGIVSPGEFISLSEESGLIVRLGQWILRSVCEQAAAWQDAGQGPAYVAVNLSAKQLQHQGFVASVRDILAEARLDPRRLVLELTESVLMQPEGHVGEAIRALADLGLHFAIDDFGTGYSSLSYLKHFPVAALKIDRAFVRHVPANADDTAIASAIVALGRALDLEVIAEGVETEDQARFLADLGCHKIQGFLFGQPVLAEEFPSLLRSDRPVPGGWNAPIWTGRSGQPAVEARLYEPILPKAGIGTPDPVDLA